MFQTDQNNHDTLTEVKLERYTDGMEYEEFVEDELTVDAVLRNFEVTFPRLAR